MSPQHIELIERSWQQLQPYANDIAPLFYSKVFSLDPRIKLLFRGAMHVQEQKLIAMLTNVIEQLHHIDDLKESIAVLGQRHRNYGVVDEHYDTVGEALLWTLEHYLGDTYTPAIKEAWTTLFVHLATTMKASPLAAARG